MSLATRPAEDIMHRLDELQDLPVVEDTHLDYWSVGDRRQRVAVIVLSDGIERVPPSVARNIGEADLGIDMVERYDTHIEVACR